MLKMNLRHGAPVALLACATPAFAHPDHGLVHTHGSGFVEGLLHPLSGADHWLAMLLVGVWAAQLGGALRWQLPVIFVALMSAGAAAALAGLQLPAVETGIVASLLVLGVAVAATLRAQAAIALPVVAALAIFHGAAHGAELPDFAQPLGYMLGFVTTTALLHAAGLGIALAAPRRFAPLLRMAGVAGIACGVALAIA